MQGVAKNSCSYGIAGVPHTAAFIIEKQPSPIRLNADYIYTPKSEETYEIP
jgi:hypothetical protein